MNAREAYKKYQDSLANEKAIIREDPKKSHRFWKCIWLAVKWPWQWLWMACHDPLMIVIFLGWMAILGCEVWVPLLIAWLNPNTALASSMYAVAATCEAFWLGPFTPFMPLCIALTIGTKAVLDKIMKKKEK